MNSTNEKIFRDQMGEIIRLSDKPSRIVSLVPSQSELLHYFGFENEVIGITKFCIHPSSWKSEKTIVGGTKSVKHDLIKSLNPDLIIANKEENSKEDILELRKHFNVYTSDINNMKGAIEMVSDLSEILGVQDKGFELISETVANFNQLSNNLKNRKSVLYFIWKTPWMTVGKQNYIDDVLRLSGFDNVILENRYPEFEPETWLELNPDVVLLSSEPFPFREEHKAYVKTILPNAKVLLVDGEMFSWYGSKMKDAAGYIESLNI